MLLILIFLMSAILAILVVGGASLYLSIHYKLNQMATKQEFLDGFAVLSESLDSIETSSKNTEADVKKLLETIDGGGISAVDENELVEVLKGNWRSVKSSFRSYKSNL